MPVFSGLLPEDENVRITKKVRIMQKKDDDRSAVILFCTAKMRQIGANLCKKFTGIAVFGLTKILLYIKIIKSLNIKHLQK